jgi:hypothetical protein
MKGKMLSLYSLYWRILFLLLLRGHDCGGLELRRHKHHLLLQLRQPLLRGQQRLLGRRYSRRRIVLLAVVLGGRVVGRGGRRGRYGSGKV